MILCIPIINTKRGNFQWIATSIIRASKELPIEATTMGPLRPLLSDHEPRKHDMKTAGSVRAIFTYKMYLAAFWFTFWSVLQSTQKSIINWQLALISRGDSTMKVGNGNFNIWIKPLNKINLGVAQEYTCSTWNRMGLITSCSLGKETRLVDWSWESGLNQA